MGFAHATDDPAISKTDAYEGNIESRVVREIDLPKGGYHEGLYYDGQNIWVNNGKNGKTWIVDPELGGVISEIDPVGTFTEGITAAGDGSYWVTDWETKAIHRVSIKDGRMEAEYDISVDPAHPAGVIYAGGRLYVVTWTRGMGTQYHLLEYDSHGNLMRKMRIKRIHEPAHITWDGKHLWLTSWYNRKIYKIDPVTLEILGAFKSPAADTTGIAWDGKYFWITGTHVGLFQVEVGEQVISDK